VNDDCVTATDLNDAIRIFMQLYRRRLVQISVGASGGGPSARGFRIRSVGEPIDDEPSRPKRPALAERKSTPKPAARASGVSEVQSAKDRFFKASIKHKWPMAPDPDDEPEDKKSRRRKKR
jgi:hypothetical protein